MKSIYKIIVIGLLPLFVAGQANDSMKLSKVRFYSFGGSPGFYVFDKRDLISYEDLRRVATNNDLIQTSDLKGYIFDHRSSYYSREVFNISVSGSLVFYNKKKGAHDNRFQLNFGFNYLSSETQKLYFTKEERIPFDTLKSNTTPEMLFVDTVKSGHYFFAYTSSRYLFTLGLSLHSQQNRMLSFYSGIYAGYGPRGKARIIAEYGMDQSYRDQYGNFYPYPWPGYDQDQSKREDSEIATSEAIMAYVPLGAQLRICTNNSDHALPFSFTLEGRFGFIKERSFHKDRLTPFWGISAGTKIIIHMEKRLKTLPATFSEI
jgi:hypothetical protein